MRVLVYIEAVTLPHVLVEIDVFGGENIHPVWEFFEYLENKRIFPVLVP
jgi:hypothetical protein